MNLHGNSQSARDVLALELTQLRLMSGEEGWQSEEVGRACHGWDDSLYRFAGAIKAGQINERSFEGTKFIHPWVTIAVIKELPSNVRLNGLIAASEGFRSNWDLCSSKNEILPSRFAVLNEQVLR